MMMTTTTTTIMIIMMMIKKCDDEFITDNISSHFTTVLNKGFIQTDVSGEKTSQIARLITEAKIKDCKLKFGFN